MSDFRAVPADAQTRVDPIPVEEHVACSWASCRRRAAYRISYLAAGAARRVSEMCPLHYAQNTVLPDVELTFGVPAASRPEHSVWMERIERNGSQFTRPCPVAGCPGHASLQYVTIHVMLALREEVATLRSEIAVLRTGASPASDRRADSSGQSTDSPR